MMSDRDGWSWFPWGALRSAGFPIRLIEPLRSPSLVAAADLVSRLDRDIGQARKTLLDRSFSLANRTQRRRLQRAINSQRPLERALCTEALEGDARNWHSLLEARARATHEFHAAYEQARAHSTPLLVELLDDDRIQRAILWQNRRVVPFLSKAKDSWDERTLLKYLSRYATKNDTIGFFGPATWIRVSTEPGFAEFRWGPALTRATLLSFEVWPIAVIASQLSENPAVRPWLVPRRSPLCRISNGKVFMPPDSAVEGGAHQLELLQLCDGRQTARAIASQLGLGGLAELAALRQADLITWTLECPMRTNPESAIAELAARIDDGDTRASVEEHSRWLVHATDRLKAGMQTSASLAAALAEIDSEFERRYSSQAVQGAGQFYAGRTLTYIDCERDASLTLKRDLMNVLMHGLAPVLLSLRWYTYTVGEKWLAALADLVPRGTGVPLVSIFPTAMSLAWSTIQDTAQQYRQKWSRLLALDPRRSIVRVNAEDLLAAVRTEFSAPHPGWPMARVHNPDVLIAATSDAALAAGQCTLVLGDVHASLPSMFQSAIFSLCPEPDTVRRLFASLVPPPPVINETSPRLNFGDFFRNAAQLWLPDEPITHLHAQAIADFDVCQSETGLQVSDVVSGQRWPVPVFFDVLLSRASFHIDPFDLPDEAHLPRVVIGDVVVARERWRLNGAALGIGDRRRADPGDRARTFLAVRRWAQDHGVPRHVFVRSAAEPKPLFVDLESQPYVELLSHLLKRAAATEPQAGHVVVSEMLPGPDRCWLRDSAGDRYTSELRLLAVDPVPYPQTSTMSNRITDARKPTS